ncbi:MAG: MerR family transcriptional regulator [Aggregatilineales bacterium]
MYTVKQLANLAGVSVRTLHHYEEIGLLKPTHIGSNRYRYYDEAAVLRLQQVLLYRELGMELEQIRRLLDDPAFDLRHALEQHCAKLEAQLGRLHELIQTVAYTLEQVKKKQPVNPQRLFRGFSAEQQAEYEREIRLSYDPEIVRESQQNWGSYSAEERQRILDEGSTLYAEIAAAIEREVPPASAEAQALMARWHQHIRHFYEPSLDILRGLPELYTTHPDFIANFAALHEQLGEYMKEAVVVYVDALETRAIERMLAEDAARLKRLNQSE